jgi:hypothetical protein
METTYTWETVDGGTRMTLRNRGTALGVTMLASPFMRSAMRRVNEKHLSALKRLLEAKTD